jgi:hypothetical protein
MRGRKYKIDQYTERDEHVVVYVSVEGYEGDVHVVPGAVDVVSWEDDMDNDLLLPVRTQTGYLRVLDEGDGVVDGMMPRNNMEHYVEVWRDNKMVWQGYMLAATYTAAWDIAPKVVEFPLIDGLTALESVYMDGTKEMRLTTLGELVHEALTAAKVDVMRVVYPKEVRVSESDAAGYAAPWLMEVSRFNFFEKSDAVNYDDPEYQRYDGITYKELLEEVCKLWGWRLVMRGWEALFLSTEAEGYVRMPLAGLKNAGTATTEEVAVTSQELAGLDWMSTDHTIERLQGYNKVTVTGVVREIGNELPTVDVEERKTIWSGWVEDGVENLEAERLIVKALKEDGTDAETRVYTAANGSVMDGAAGERSLAWKVGALMVKQDIHKYKDPTVRRYSYKDVLRIVTRDYSDDANKRVTESESKVRPVAILRGGAEAYYKEGALVLKATAEGLVYSAAFSPTGGGVGIAFFSINKTTNGKSKLPVSVRVGDMWWNGTGWQSVEAIFAVRVGNQDDEGSDSGTGKIVSTQTIEMPYEEGDGYIMPITERMSGDVVLTVYAPWETTSDVIMLQGLEIAYVGIEDESRKHKEGNNRYRAVLNNGFKQEKEVELLMTTSNNNPSAYSVLSYGGGDVNTLLFPGGAMRPEEALLGKLKRNYGGIVEVLTVDVEDAGKVDTLTKVVHEDKEYRVLAEAVDLMAGSKKVRMVKI